MGFDAYYRLPQRIANADILTHTDSYCHIHTCRDSFTNADSHRYIHPDTNGHSKRYRNGNSDSDCNSYSYTFPDSHNNSRDRFDRGLQF